MPIRAKNHRSELLYSPRIAEATSNDLIMVNDHSNIKTKMKMEGKMPETISISEFKATCLKVIDKVKNTGIPIIVTKRGEPYALVTKPPVPEKKDSWIGMYEGKIKAVGDILEPVVPPEEWDVLK
jgi:prevent-host-death family protein